MRTAVAWLEEALLLTREENRVQVFPSSLRVSSIEAAQVRLARADIAEHYREQLLRICQALFEADADEGISTDELMIVKDGEKMYRVGGPIADSGVVVQRFCQFKWKATLSV